jgi:hypothetical protein
MKTIFEVLLEAKVATKKAFLITGAFNPYTHGHEEVARTAAHHASSSGYTHFYHGLGASENVSDAPLSFKQKEKIVKGSHKHIAGNLPKEHKGKLKYGIVPQKSSVSPFHQLVHLIEKEGHNHITVALGPDQMASEGGKPSLKQSIESHINKHKGILGSDGKTVHKIKIDFHSLASKRNEEKLSIDQQRKLIKDGRMPVEHAKAGRMREAILAGADDVAHAHMPESVRAAGIHKQYASILRKQFKEVVPKNEEKLRIARNARAKELRDAKKAAKVKESILPDPILDTILEMFLTEKESKETRRKRDRRMYGHGKSLSELTPKQRLNRKKKSKRTVARRRANREGRTKKGDSSVELDHKNGNAMDNGKDNLRVVSRHHNRSRNNNKNH